MKLDLQYRNNWLEFYGNKIENSSLSIGPSGYFDDRLFLNFQITFILGLIGLCLTGLSLYSLLFLPILFKGWGSVYLHLPIHSGIDDAEPPQYGFYTYSEDEFIPESFWICTGNDVKCFDFPWRLEWYRTLTLKVDDTYYIESPGKYLDLFEKEKYPDVKYESYPYKYTLKNGEVQNVMAEISVNKREWRPKWLWWTSLFSYKKNSININFSSEVGERTGSWKGGTVGCSYGILPNETPYECLKRMEQERSF